VPPAAISAAAAAPATATLAIVNLMLFLKEMSSAPARFRRPCAWGDDCCAADERRLNKVNSRARSAFDEQ
jgi:hypothetical protein